MEGAIQVKIKDTEEMIRGRKETGRKEGGKKDYIFGILCYIWFCVIIKFKVPQNIQY